MSTHLPPRPSIWLRAGGVAALAMAAHAADIIPVDRRMDWQPGVNVGVPGGIPNRSTIFVNVLATANASYKCAGNGTKDDTAALQRALDDCPDGQVVYLPAGTYKITGGIRSQNSFATLRGAGQGRTVIKPTNVSGLGALLWGSADWPRPTAGKAITAGATAGSTTVSVAATAGYAVGNLARIDPANPTWVKNLNGAGKTMSFTFRVVSKTASSVTFTPALPMDLSGMSPVLVPYAAATVEGVGVEDLTIDLLASPDLTGGIYMEQIWGSWVKNVEIVNSNHRQMFFYEFCAGEVRHCYTHGTRSGGPGHEGIDLYGDDCWNLIEDNIVHDGGFPGIILGDSAGGCQGNVVAYNYGAAVDVGSPDTGGADFSFAHGPHNVLNLAEGNVFSMIQADGYFGSSSHNTIFRNWMTVAHPTATGGLRAVDLTHFNDFYSVVGNVLGSPGFTGVFDSEVSNFDNGSKKMIYRLGYPNMGNMGFSGTLPVAMPPNYTGLASTLSGTQQLDLNVKATLIRHGNYDYVNKAQQWDAGIASRTMPSSLFRTAKPTWFGDRAWPPVDPANPGALAIDSIPAGYRFVHGVEPPVGGNLPPSVSVATATPAMVTATSTALSATAGDDGGEAALAYTWSSTGPAAVAFSANGSNAAKATTATFAKAGSYVLTVTAKDAGNLSASRTVAVTVDQTLATLHVTPATAQVVANGTVALDAEGLDQFGVKMAVNPSWSVISGGAGGTVSAAGLFTAPAAVGTTTVRAAQSGKSDTAVIMIRALQAFSAQVNFQPSQAPIDAGWLLDSGLPYGARYGQTYGWNVDLSSASYLRDRNSPDSPDQEHDTLIVIGTNGQGAATWEMAVPNGTYAVTVLMGDPSLVRDNHYACALEGAPAIDATATTAQKWIEVTMTVTVGDGRLSLAFAGGAHVRNKLCSIVIIPSTNG